MTGFQPGTPCWFQLSSSDVAASKQFYAAVFDWKFRDDPMGPSYVYTTFLKGDAKVGGLTPAQPGVPPHWDVYFESVDLEASATKVAAAGGNVVLPPMDVADLGRMAYFTDREGAGFGVWQSGTHKGADVTHEFGSNAWVELAARQTASAAEFYAGLFGWAYVEQEIPQAGLYRRIDAAGKQWGGILQMDANWGEMPSHWSMYVMVENADATGEKIKAAGGSLPYSLFDAPGVGRLGVVKDPQGAHFYIIQRETAPTA